MEEDPIKEGIHQASYHLIMAGRVYGKPRNGKWRTKEKQHLLLHPTCAGCGGTNLLQVHHCLPYHKYPELELVESNLLTLCMDPNHLCHYVLGHLLSWQSWNVDVIEDAAAFLKKVQHRPI